MSNLKLEGVSVPFNETSGEVSAISPFNKGAGTITTKTKTKS
jgi:hypothetical protein